MVKDRQGTKWRRNIAENFNRLSRVYQRYRRQTDRRQTNGRRHIANMNMSSRSLKRVDCNFITCRVGTSLVGYKRCDSLAPSTTTLPVMHPALLIRVIPFHSNTARVRDTSLQTLLLRCHGFVPQGAE